MKMQCKLNDRPVELEVYKVQVALFGGPSVLIYNEDRTQQWQEDKPNNVKALRKFIGNRNVKVYALGYQDFAGRIVLQKVLPRNMWDDIHF